MMNVRLSISGCYYRRFEKKSQFSAGYLFDAPMASPEMILSRKNV